MKSVLVAWLFDLAAWLPLRVLHLLGSMLGQITYWSSGNYAARLRENLENGLQGTPATDIPLTLQANIREMGKSIVELPWLWRRPVEEILHSIRVVHGAEHLTASHNCGKGIIVLTPHLGSFEIVGLYLASRMPITCMYRVPRIGWLDPIIRSGRERGQMKLARADVGGVRTLLKALKRGEVIGLLPDQVPGNGEGEWAPFFGRPAYTMTLLARLAEASGADILLSYGERLPKGAGYIIHFAPFEFSGDQPFASQLNAALERIILTCPAQYLWSYNRYKAPRGITPPERAGER